MAAVEARVDDRHADRVDDGEVGAERVERMVLPEVVLPRDEWVARREAQVRGQCVRRRRQHERERRNRCRPSHWFETCSTGVIPAT